MKDEPGLPGIKSGFSVPDGYFESFSERLKLRIEAEEMVPPVRKNLMVYLRPAMGIAAGLAILMTVYLHPFVNRQDNPVANIQELNVDATSDRSETMLSSLSSTLSEGQFLSAMDEMDEYDASKMPKEVLSDYLASNCSELEILDANK